MERKSKPLTKEDKLIAYYESYGLIYNEGLILCGACDDKLYDDEDPFLPDAHEIVCNCRMPEGWESFFLDPDEDDEDWDIDD